MALGFQIELELRTVGFQGVRKNVLLDLNWNHIWWGGGGGAYPIVMPLLATSAANFHDQHFDSN